MVKIGQTATASELKARWAYAEMRSSRFRRHFEHAGYRDLLEKATAGIPFCKLSREEQQQLGPALHASRNEDFARSIEQHDTYECVEWTEDDLTRSWALPTFNPARDGRCISYQDFYSGAPDTSADGTPNVADPRVAAQKAEPEVAYRQQEPVIVIGRPGEYILLEGYFRSIQFKKSPDSSKRLLAWVPIIVK